MGLIYYPGSGYVETSPYGSRGGSYHYGIDFGAPLGTGIPAATSGIVWRSGKSDTYGYYVILQHTGTDGKNFYTLYAHMQDGSQTKNVGEEVKTGETIGNVDKTGRVDVKGDGGVLHFEVIDPNGTNGNGVEPQKGIVETKEQDGGIGTGYESGATNRIDPDKFNDWPLGGPYDGGVCSDPNYHERSFFQRLYDLVYGIPDSFSRYFTRATQWRPSSDPLSLDLDGDGIETVGINTNNPILFDHNADGVKTATGWMLKAGYRLKAMG